MGITPDDLADGFDTKWNENQARFDGRRAFYGTPESGYGASTGRMSITDPPINADQVE
jgi:hypothetical protein